MKILTYDQLYNNNNNKFIDINIIDKLIYNNINYYNLNNISYYLLVIPNLNIYNHIDNDVYSLIEKKITNKFYDFSIPSIIFNKIIIIYNHQLKKFLLIKSDNYPLINNDNITNNKTIINILIIISHNLHKIINIHNNLIMNINNAFLNIDYNKINILNNFVDKLIIYSHYCSNVLQQLNNIKILINKSHQYYYILNRNINNLLYINNKLKNDLHNIRQTAFQKITYIETGTGRILTSIATVFLPLSFIIAFFSLPFKNIPLQNNNNGITYLLFIIFITLIIIYIFFKLNLFNLDDYIF
jgi:Mg2+ and Co2+ transporter CorA